MLKLELKRIFSKKINVFAIGLALILAVIFSGFAVTSNRYVDENGNASVECRYDLRKEHSLFDAHSYKLSKWKSRS